MTVDEGVMSRSWPGTGDPVPEGDVGEVVVTTSTAPIRWSASAPATCRRCCRPEPVRRTNMRIKGWMGRADQRTKVRGMFVDPEQIAEVAKKHPGSPPAPGDRLGQSGRHDDAQGRGAVTFRRSREGDGRHHPHRLQGRGKVEFAKPGSLPNDGKVIDDVRKYT